MKTFLAILVLMMIVSLRVEAQDVRSKVGPTSETSVTNIIDPDKSVYGAQWGCNEDEFIKKFSYATGYLRLGGTQTAMLYGKDHAFIFTASKLSGVRISSTVLDWKLSQAQITRPFDDVRWQLSNGVRREMNLAEVKKILGESLKIDGLQRYFDSDRARVELDFRHYTNEGEKDEAYKLFGIYIRPISEVVPKASVRPLQTKIPEPTGPQTSEELNWWQEVTAASKQYADAIKRKDEFVHEAFTHPHQRINRIDYEARASLGGGLAKLRAEALSARTRYMSLIREGEEKAYRPQLGDVRGPTILYKDWPSYTDEARDRKISGAVQLRVIFGSDGVIGNVKVIKGLGYGLDEEAVARTQDIVFLPAVKGGRFTTWIMPVTIEFSTR
jgi:TonB family protein